MADTVKMQFPAKREYLKAIRLAVAGIACNSAYDVDEIEDLKTCVAESCILFLCRQKSETLEIVVDCGDHVSVTAVSYTHLDVYKRQWADRIFTGDHHDKHGRSD